MIEGKIRVVCLGIVHNGKGKYLFDRMEDPKKNISFLRPIGGGVEFGESIEGAIQREFYEEIEAKVASTSRIASFDNIFEYNGKQGHEIIFLCNVELQDKVLYSSNEITISEGNEDRVARWYSIQDLEKELIYPLEVKKYLGTINDCSNLFNSITDTSDKSLISSEQNIQQRENFYVLSGCSGGGKSSLLAELRKRGFLTVQEPGREIVKQQVLIDGHALPWKNMDLFLELALARYLSGFSEHSLDEPVFFDRGVVDSVPSGGNFSQHFDIAAKKYLYNGFLSTTLARAI